MVPKRVGPPLMVKISLWYPWPPDRYIKPAFHLGAAFPQRPYGFDTLRWYGFQTGGGRRTCRYMSVHQRIATFATIWGKAEDYAVCHGGVEDGADGQAIVDATSLVDLSAFVAPPGVPLFGVPVVSRLSPSPTGIVHVVDAGRLVVWCLFLGEIGTPLVKMVIVPPVLMVGYIRSLGWSYPGLN